MAFILLSSVLTMVGGGVCVDKMTQGTEQGQHTPGEENT